MATDYSQNALRRLGASLVAHAAPASRSEAVKMLESRMGPYVAGTSIIKEVIDQRYAS